MDQEKIGNFIRKLRKEHHLSQQAFADKLGVTFQAVSKWETGKNLPDVLLLKEISKQFHVNIDEIINGENRKPKKEYKYFFFGTLIVIGMIILLIFIIFDHKQSSQDYEFNEVKTTNNDFSISGSVVKTNERTSLMITNVNYQGKEDQTVYKSLSCDLYEEKKNTKTKISSCDKEENKTLIEYLENVKIKMDHYSTNCNMFVHSEIFIEITALDRSNKNVIYKIPIQIHQDNCD